MINIAVKEWSAVVHALGEGSQTIMIRKQEPKSTQFLFYPTFSFIKKPNWQYMFKPRYHNLVQKVGQAVLDAALNDQIEMRYYAEFVDAVSADTEKIHKVSAEYIWSDEHVDGYALYGAVIWLLRVYRLPKPVPVGVTLPAGGDILYYQHFTEVDITGAKPVLNDSEFERRRKAILNALR